MTGAPRSHGADRSPSAPDPAKRDLARIGPPAQCASTPCHRTPYLVNALPPLLAAILLAACGSPAPTPEEVAGTRTPLGEATAAYGAAN